MRIHTIKNLVEFVKTVNKISAEWTGNDDNIIYPWFRGHACESFDLIPGLYRSDKNSEMSKEDEEYEQDQRELDYRHEFEMKAYPFLLNASYGTPQNSFEWYFLMQHYGLPTRLLDWTESSLTALHFAIFYKDEQSEEDACVWVLHPFKFNETLHGLEQVFIFEEDLKNYLPPLWRGKAITEPDPIALQPILKSNRITAQKGQFTLHGNERTPLNKIKRVANWLEKIIIPHQFVDKIKRELYLSGVTESVLFPDLSGLCREIKDYYRR